ncbi:protein kinase domain-containing protein [Chloropicon roscoffensis]|uniref:Protein kinase domain-containing protein n=1 Tax=Chloropicon roscoffensis TaxID=1461544 RepID=A0AAX4P5J9_9CHLO
MFAKLTSLVTGSSLPFTLGDDKGTAWNWWTLHDAKMKADGAKVSVFRAIIPNTDEVKLGLARNSLKRLRGMKHPSIVSFKDSHEMPDRSNVTFYIVTEPVVTLAAFLDMDEMRGNPSEVLAWGLRAVVSGVSFLTNECKLVYGSLCFGSVFVSHTLDWKLGIFDLLSDHAGLAKALDPQPFAQGFPFVSGQYLPGEVHKKEWQAVADAPAWAVDAWGLGCFIQELFKGAPMEAVAELRNLGAIPRGLQGDYQKLLSSQPQKRLNPQQLLQRNSFFRTKLNDIVEFLDNLILKEEVERNRFFRSLKTSLRSLPAFLIQRKILPACLAAVEFGNVSTAALQAILDLVECVADETYFEQDVLPFLLKLLGSTDVTVRLMLLSSAAKFIRLLSGKMIESKFYPGLQPYFKDADPRIRDQTIKCMSLLAPKMNQKTLNSSLLPHLAQLQRDPEAAIRTNTTVLISKISQYLGEASCKRILLNAFTRVLNDPAPSVRNAGILAIKETSQYYGEEDISRKLVPTLAPLVTDADPGISISSFQCLEKSFQVLRAYAERREKELASVAPPQAQARPSEPSGGGFGVDEAAAASGGDPWTAGGDNDGLDLGMDLGGMDLGGDDGGWDDGGLDEMLQGSGGGVEEPSLDDGVSQHLGGLMGPAGAEEKVGPGARRKHLAPPRKTGKGKPMKLGATKRAPKSGGDDDAWGDLLA